MGASIFDWSKTAATNATADADINWAEGQSPSTVNNSAREMMARVAEWRDDGGGELTVGGTANALTITANSAFSAYADGQTISLRIATDNTTAATLNVNGIGTKTIRKMVATGESALTGAELQAGGIYDFKYSEALDTAAGGWLLLNPTFPIDTATLVTLTGTQTLTNKTLTSPTINTPTVTGGTSSGVTMTTATLTTPTLTLKQSAAPTPTAEGDTQWDTDDNVLTIGDGAATKLFLPIPASTAAGDIEYFTAAKVKARLAKGTAGQVLRMNSGATAPEWGTAGAPDAVLEDQKASGTDGGSSTSGSWQTRTLNTEAKDTYSLVSIAANAFTPTVDGWVEWSAPATRSGSHQSRLYNVTGAAVVSYGTSAATGAGADTSTISEGGGAVTAGTAYRIEHRVTTTKATDGYGQANSFGGTEVYTRVKFWRTA